MGVSTVRGSGGVSDIAIIHSSRRAGTVLTIILDLMNVSRTRREVKNGK